MSKQKELQTQNKPNTTGRSSELKRTEKGALQKRTSKQVIKKTRTPISNNWQVVCEAAVGLSHRRMTPPMPCQDACMTMNQTRTALFLADGAGSAKKSDKGSRMLVQSLKRLLASIEGVLSKSLDQARSPVNFENQLAEIVYRYAVNLVIDLAENDRRSAKDFRSTLLLAIVGKQKTFWLKVGDGAIIYQDNNNKLHLLGAMEKGDFANQTVFVDDQLAWDDVQFGTLPSKKVSGIALMSDGAAERFVSYDGTKIAPFLNKWFQLLVTEELKQESLFKFFNDEETWRGSTHDDKSMALAVRSS